MHSDSQFENIASSSETELIRKKRAELLREQGLGQADHYRRLEEKPFTKEQRSSTTIVFGGLPVNHEALIKAVFQGAGYLFENLPTPTNAAFQVGREYCNSGLCNPSYFTAGALIRFLQTLEEQGLTREQVIAKYVYFTAADCGPCRFGTYEAEYRRALYDAGFGGFRVITFQNNNIIGKGASEPGLKFNADMGCGILNALILGDLLYEATYQIRPYEVNPGDTDQAIADVVEMLSTFLRERKHFEILESSPEWLFGRLSQKPKFRDILNSLGKFREHLYGEPLQKHLAQCADRLNQVKVDRTRPKPIVKIVGEFFSHISEGDANYRMFSFLEKEGAEVGVDTVTNLVLYWLYKAKLGQIQRIGLEPPNPNPGWWQLHKHLANQLSFRKKPLLFTIADRVYSRQYHRIGGKLGGISHGLVKQKIFSRLAAPYYDPLTRGGEGHLEVAKSIYYTRNRLCHMVLSLKPFGCMPSTQSDGVMAAVTSQHDDLLFVSIETSGDGEINAFSRVQMALTDARRRAKEEFQGALELTGKRLDDIRDYIAARPELQQPSYSFPRHQEMAGVAANFVLHVSSLMDRK